MNRHERTFYWTLMTEISSACGGGASVVFMVESWQNLASQISEALVSQAIMQDSGLEEEAAAVLRAIAASVQQLKSHQVRQRQEQVQLSSSAVCALCV
jgi:hypothetical protein